MKQLKKKNEAKEKLISQRSRRYAERDAANMLRGSGVILENVLQWKYVLQLQKMMV